MPRTQALSRQLVCHFALYALVAPSLSAQSLGEGFDAYVRAAVQEWDATGLAIAVVKDGELVFADGYGVRNLETGGPVDEHTRFAIGSTTKAMTAAALGMLVDEGKVAWDDAVTDYLPWFAVDDPYLTHELTIRDLLTHRAGMGNTDVLWYERDTTTREVLGKMARIRPAYSLRSSFIYQNLMYAAAGEVVAGVSGMPWTEFVRTRIFQPLGMDETVPLLSEASGGINVADPHDRVEGRTVPIGNASVDPVAAAGSVWSSVSDMSRWLRFLLAEGVTLSGERLLADSTVSELFRPQTLVTPEAFYPTREVTRPDWITYGLGWFQHDYRGHKVDFHTGSIDGMVAIAGLIRDLDLGVYVLANRDHVEVRHALMYRAFDHFLEGTPRDWSTEFKVLYDGLARAAAEREERSLASRIPGTSPTFPPARYVGTYADPVYGSLTVTESGGRLRVDWGPGQVGTMEHWHHDTFRISWEAKWRGSALVTFQQGADGGIASVTMGRMVLGRTP
ncbi:MAG: serine hydrolase [Gemmatimonadota bacterium]|nr:serine hydrolase [Gemmatimonadota bacterium]MDH5761092.1 serine hydrolase [Gemmatimonadota bacterium]